MIELKDITFAYLGSAEEGCGGQASLPVSRLKACFKSRFGGADRQAAMPVPLTTPLSRQRLGDAFSLRVPALSIQQGEHVAIVGPSGSGKTTLLSLIAGILVPDSGVVCVDGKDVSAMSEKARRRFRLSRIGMVFQGIELIEYLSVQDNVMLPFRLSRQPGATAAASAASAARADELLEQVGLAGLKRRKAARLSVGEQQRVGLCRALVARPSIVLADEPTSALDDDNAAAVLDLMLGLARDNGQTLVMLTHDKSLLPRFDRVVTVDRGAVSETVSGDVTERTSGAASGGTSGGTSGGVS